VSSVKNARRNSNRAAELKIIIRDIRNKIRVNNQKIKYLVLKIISDEGLIPAGEVNISFITDFMIKKLNSRFHRRTFSTDVLAFDLSLGNKDELTADIYISVDTAVKNSRIFRTEPRTELYLYVIHGMLHIAGYDDHSLRDTKIMRSKEEFYLTQILPKAACGGVKKRRIIKL